MTNLQELNEEWKDVSGYEGLYQVSNLGRVYSFPRAWNINPNVIFKHDGKILKLNPNHGYRVAQLLKNSITQAIFVHRVVATAFIPNVHNKPYVNHKNGIRDDNRVENLEWCTSSENNLHAYRTLNRKKSSLGKSGILSPSIKPVIAYLKDGTKKEYISMTEAAKDLNVCLSGISNVLKGKIEDIKGFKFTFVNIGKK